MLDKTKENINALYDGVCAIHGFSYNKFQNEIDLSKRGFYLARKEGRLSQKRITRRRLLSLIKNSNVNLSEIVKLGKMIREIQEVNPSQIILSLLYKKKLTIKGLADEIGIKKGAIERWLGNPNFKFRDKRISLKLAEYCQKNNVDIKKTINLIDLRRLTPQEVTFLILGLMKQLKLSNKKFEQFGIPPTTISRWLKSKYKILQYKCSFILNDLINKSGFSLEELLQSGQEIKSQFDFLGNKLNQKITSCNFSLNVEERRLLENLEMQFPNSTILPHPHLIINGFKFEPDFLLFDKNNTYWLEVTDTKYFNLHLGWLQSRALFINNHLKPDNFIIISNIDITYPIEYLRLIRSGTLVHSIEKLESLKSGIMKLKEKLNSSKKLIKSNLISGKELKLVREFYFCLSQQQLAILFDCSQQSISLAERKQTLKKAINNKLDQLKAYTIREVHREANKKLGRLHYHYPEIILDRGRGTLGILDKEISKFLKDKGFDAISNAVLSNKNVTMVAEADVYLPKEKIVVSCKNSINHSKGYSELIWDLFRYKWVEEIQNVILFSPRIPSELKSLLKKYNIQTAISKEELTSLCQQAKKN